MIKTTTNRNTNADTNTHGAKFWKPEVPSLSNILLRSSLDGYCGSVRKTIDTSTKDNSKEEIEKLVQTFGTTAISQDCHHFSVVVKNELDCESSNYEKSSSNTSFTSSTSEASSSIVSCYDKNHVGRKFGDGNSIASACREPSSCDGFDSSNQNDDDLSITFSIARTRIAKEAANEALNRIGDQQSCTITTVGCGSSRADKVHERDMRPIWQQGLHQKMAIDNPEVVDNDAKFELVVFIDKCDFQESHVSVAEQAAAMGRVKEQARIFHENDKKTKHRQVNSYGEEQKREMITLITNDGAHADNVASIEVELVKQVQDTAVGKEYDADDSFVFDKTYCDQDDSENEIHNNKGYESSDDSVPKSSNQQKTSSSVQLFAVFALAVARFSSKINKTRHQAEAENN